MGLISRVYYFFASYTDARERAVGLFFRGLTEHSDRTRSKKKLGQLLQRNIAVINLWSEYRYKGYKYLSKSERRKLYRHLQLIADDFETFRSSRTGSPETVLAHVHQTAPGAKVDTDKIMLLHAIMEYFSPARGVYVYRESSSFGRLLRDPTREKLVGDCNQIVTLYIYLYSLYFDVSDLQIRLLPGHVALHYGGVDIEATNATFADYSRRSGGTLQPIEEIASVNLLDTTDSYLETHEAAAEDLLQASRFAFILSHDHELVRYNLEAAYARLINLLMKRHNYSQALKLAKTSRDMTLLGVVGHNGAIYEMQRHNYQAARKFADYAPKKSELIADSYRSEGAYHYDAHRYHEAITAFKHYGDASLVKRSYEALFFMEQEKLGGKLTNETVKKHAKTIKQMHTYAKKSGNKKLVEHADQLLKYL